MNCGIYKLEFSDGSFYIGSSCNLPGRRASHEKSVSSGCHKNINVQYCYNRLGMFKFRILLICRKSDLLLFEQIAIDALSPCLNLSLKAGTVDWSSATRAKMSETTRKRYEKEGVREARSEQAKEVWGRPGYREMMSEKIKEARRRDECWTDKIREARKTPESRAKTSEALKGNKYNVGRILSHDTRRLLSVASKRAWARRKEEGTHRASDLARSNMSIAQKVRFSKRAIS